MFDTLEADEISASVDTVRLYSSINKATELGLTMDGSKIPSIEIERMYTVHSALIKAQLARSRRK